MGNGICSCENTDLNNKCEIKIGHGVYNFKKMVNKFNKLYILNIESSKR